MRKLLLLALLVFGVTSWAQEHAERSREGKSALRQQIGSEERPLIVRVAAPQTPEEHSYEHYEKVEKPKNEKSLVDSTVALAIVTGVLAVFTGGLWFATYLLGKEAKRTSTQQAQDVQASIKEATRSASAMEQLADAMTANVKLVTKLQDNLPKQMRAYIHVNIGEATYQDENFQFQAVPVLQNSGLTPARNLSFSINAGIYATHLPNTFKFPEPELVVKGDNGITPRQTYTIRSPAINRIPEGEVIDVMKGEKRRLYVWGTITYDDVFEGHHFTNFCYSIYWVAIKEEIRVFGDYHSAHNNAD